MKTELLNAGSISKTFKLELNIVLTDEQQQKLVEAARRVYPADPPSARYEAEFSREVGAEEFVDGPGTALICVIEQNIVLDELDTRSSEVPSNCPSYLARRLNVPTTVTRGSL